MPVVSNEHVRFGLAAVIAMGFTGGGFVRRAHLDGTVSERPQQPMKTKVLALHSPPFDS